MAALVDNPQIKHAELLRPLPFHFHAYVWPFAIVWPIFLRYYLSEDLYEKHIGGSEWTFVWCGAIITVQSLVWLSTHWSVALDARFTASKAKDVQDALLIKVLPIANAGSGEICKLVRDKVRLIGSFKDLHRLRQLTRLFSLGWRQDQYLIPVPETPFPLQSGYKLLQLPPICHRRRAQAHHWRVPNMPRHR